MTSERLILAEIFIPLRSESSAISSTSPQLTGQINADKILIALQLIAGSSPEGTSAVLDKAKVSFTWCVGLPSNPYVDPVESVRRVTEDFNIALEELLGNDLQERQFRGGNMQESFDAFMESINSSGLPAHRPGLCRPASDFEVAHSPSDCSDDDEDVAQTVSRLDRARSACGVPHSASIADGSRGITGSMTGASALSIAAPQTIRLLSSTGGFGPGTVEHR